VLLSVSAEECEYERSIKAVSCRGFARVHGKLKLDGVQLVGSSGAPVQLRGVSSHGLQWFGECVTLESITYLVENWGINVFRAVVYIDADKGGYLSDPEYFNEFVSNIVHWCEQLGIYVIIDWHVLSQGDPNTYLSSPGENAGPAIDFWKYIANTYKNHTNVIYEIANEPNNVQWSRVLMYHNAVIQEIRSIDSETIIIAGTTTWSQDIHLAADTPVSMPYHVMYTFHFYAATHSSLIPRVSEYITRVPLFVSEFSLSTASGDGSYDGPTTTEFLNLFAGLSQNTSIAGSDPVFVSFTLWSYCDKSETSAVLNPTSCNNSAWGETSCVGTYHSNYFREEKFEQNELRCEFTLATAPSNIPTTIPTAVPSTPTLDPTMTPTSPTTHPSFLPSRCPVTEPTGIPSTVPSLMPSGGPSEHPTPVPSLIPTPLPTKIPSREPTQMPTSTSETPTCVPSGCPVRSLTSRPTADDTVTPTWIPTITPTPLSTKPTQIPTTVSLSPTYVPFGRPVCVTTSQPTVIPTLSSSTSTPSTFYSYVPTDLPARTTPTLVPTSPNGLKSSQTIRAEARQIFSGHILYVMVSVFVVLAVGLGILARYVYGKSVDDRVKYLNPHDGVNCIETCGEDALDRNGFRPKGHTWLGTITAFIFRKKGMDSIPVRNEDDGDARTCADAEKMSVAIKMDVLQMEPQHPLSHCNHDSDAGTRL